MTKNNYALMIQLHSVMIINSCNNYDKKNFISYGKGTVEATLAI